MVQALTFCRVHSDEFPCAFCHTGVGSNSVVCRTGVGSNSIFGNRCKHWLHKKSSGLQCLRSPDYRCTQCQRTARPLDGRPQREVKVVPDKLEVVASFCYLGDMLPEPVAMNFQPQHVWKLLRRSSRSCSLFPPSLFQDMWPRVQLCVRSTMLQASETWPLTKQKPQCLQRNDRAMIRQICNVKPQDNVTIRSNELLVRLGIEDLGLILKEKALLDMERSNNAVKTACDIQVDGWWWWWWYGIKGVHVCVCVNMVPYLP